MRRAASALALLIAATAALADDAPRVIAPERFAPTPQDPAATRAPIVMPSREHPYGACQHGAHDWLACLDATARVSDSAVDDEEARLIESLDRRPRLNAVVRNVLTKALKDANEAWRALRELECGPLSLIERGIDAPIYEARLICRLRRNAERAQELAARYDEAP